MSKRKHAILGLIACGVMLPASFGLILGIKTDDGLNVLDWVIISVLAVVYLTCVVVIYRGLMAITRE